MKARLALILTIPLILIGIAARSGAQNPPTLICSGGWCPPFTVSGNNAALAGGFAVNGAAATGALNVSGTTYYTGLTAEGGTKSALCIDTATSQMETNAAATCTVSSLRFKEWKQDISCPEARRIVKGMRPAEFKDKDGTDKPRFGFAAEWTYQVEPRLVYTESDGKTPRAVDYERYVAVLTKVLQCGGLN